MGHKLECRLRRGKSRGRERSEPSSLPQRLSRRLRPRGLRSKAGVRTDPMPTAAEKREEGNELFRRGEHRAAAKAYGDA
eukprot:COSAG04_NODE_7936_length_1044_cov_2.644444_1_plen_78_part_10